MGDQSLEVTHADDRKAGGESVEVVAGHDRPVQTFTRIVCTSGNSEKHPSFSVNKKPGEISDFARLIFPKFCTANIRRVG